MFLIVRRANKYFHIIFINNKSLQYKQKYRRTNNRKKKRIGHNIIYIYIYNRKFIYFKALDNLEKKRFYNYTRYILY